MDGDISSNQQDFIFNLRKRGRVNVDWAELPSELLVEIIENHLVSVEDCVALSGVCRSWRKAFWACDMDIIRQHWAHQMPWLMLTDGKEEFLSADDLHARRNCIEDDDEEGISNSVQEEEETVVEEGANESGNLCRRTLLNLRHRKNYNVSCSQGYGRNCCWGSAHGWILIHGTDKDMYLFNPLTKARLNLPSLRTLPNRAFLSNYMDRAAILKVPSDVPGKTILVVVLIYNGGCAVAVAKPGDTKWVDIDGLKVRIVDVSYAGRGLVFLGDEGNVACCALPGHQEEQLPALRWYGCKLKILTDSILSIRSGYCHLVDRTTYLVNSGEDTMMVLRVLRLDGNLDDTVRNDDKVVDGYETVLFKVYKFLFDDKRWEELQELQDVALFVGNNAAISVCATDAGCERNCIYFTDDNVERYFETKDALGGHDMGVFRMDDKSIRPLNLGINHHLRSSYCCPFWFSPAL